MVLQTEHLQSALCNHQSDIYLNKLEIEQLLALIVIISIVQEIAD